MKNLKRMLLLVLILIGSNVIEAYSSVIITIKLARHRDCIGFGWCKGTIVVDPDIAAKPFENQVNCSVDINRDGKLVATFNKKTDMTPEAFLTYFSKGIFVCEDDFPVPFSILKALNYSKPYTIKAGDYPVVTNGDILTVVF